MGILTFAARYIGLPRIVKLIAGIEHYFAHVGSEVVTKNPHMEI